MTGRTRMGVAGLGLAAAVGVALLASGRLDRTLPTLAVTGAPPTPVAGPVDLDLRVHDARPGLGGWTARIDDRPAALTRVEDRTTLDVSALADGPHTLVIEAWDRAWPPNLARVEVPLVVDATPPVLRLARRSLATVQGRALPLLVQADGPLAALTGTFREQPLTFLPLAGSEEVWRALVGIPIEARTGARPLDLVARDAAGNETRLQVPVAIDNGRFTKGGTIRLRPDQVEARKDEAAKARMREERDAAYTWDQPRALWSGPMLRPVDGGRLSSPFGRYRTYSDGKKSHHTGTDIAAPRGTPVLAAAAGEVRFAGEQAIFGNVVILGHGQGLSTSYNHLSEISVQVGQAVQQGEVVGAVGSTGQSTGPHLHWGVTVGTTAVDGLPLLEDDLGFDGDPGWTHVTEDGRLIPVAPPGEALGG